MSDHCLHVSSLSPCQIIVSMSAHCLHVRSLSPCQIIVSMSDHCLHVSFVYIDHYIDLVSTVKHVVRHVGFKTWWKWLSRRI